MAPNGLTMIVSIIDLYLTAIISFGLAQFIDTLEFCLLLCIIGFCRSTIILYPFTLILDSIYNVMSWTILHVIFSSLDRFLLLTGRGGLGTQKIVEFWYNIMCTFWAYYLPAITIIIVASFCTSFNIIWYNMIPLLISTEGIVFFNYTMLFMLLFTPPTFFISKWVSVECSRPHAKFQIFVSRPNGSTVLFNVDHGQKVGDLRRLIAARENISESDQVLTFGTKCLSDDSTLLCCYGIRPLSTVDMSLRLNGGHPKQLQSEIADTVLGMVGTQNVNAETLLLVLADIVGANFEEIVSWLGDKFNIPPDVAGQFLKICQVQSNTNLASSKPGPSSASLSGSFPGSVVTKRIKLDSTKSDKQSTSVINHAQANELVNEFYAHIGTLPLPPCPLRKGSVIAKSTKDNVLPAALTANNFNRDPSPTLARVTVCKYAQVKGGCLGSCTNCQKLYHIVTTTEGELKKLAKGMYGPTCLGGFHIPAGRSKRGKINWICHNCQTSQTWTAVPPPPSSSQISTPTLSISTTSPPPPLLVVKEQLSEIMSNNVMVVNECDMDKSEDDDSDDDYYGDTCQASSTEESDMEEDQVQSFPHQHSTSAHLKTGNPYGDLFLKKYLNPVQKLYIQKKFKSVNMICRWLKFYGKKFEFSPTVKYLTVESNLIVLREAPSSNLPPGLRMGYGVKCSCEKLFTGISKCRSPLDSVRERIDKMNRCHSACGSLIWHTALGHNLDISTAEKYYYAVDPEEHIKRFIRKALGSRSLHSKSYFPLPIERVAYDHLCDCFENENLLIPSQLIIESGQSVEEWLDNDNPCRYFLRVMMSPQAKYRAQKEFALTDSMISSSTKVIPVVVDYLTVKNNTIVLRRGKSATIAGLGIGYGVAYNTGGLFIGKSKRHLCPLAAVKGRLQALLTANSACGSIVWQFALGNHIKSETSRLYYYCVDPSSLIKMFVRKALQDRSIHNISRFPTQIEKDALDHLRSCFSDEILVVPPDLIVKDNDTASNTETLEFIAAKFTHSQPAVQENDFVVVTGGPHSGSQGLVKSTEDRLCIVMTNELFTNQVIKVLSCHLFVNNDPRPQLLVDRSRFKPVVIGVCRLTELLAFRRQFGSPNNNSNIPYSYRQSRNSTKHLVFESHRFTHSWSSSKGNYWICIHHHRHTKCKAAGYEQGNTFELVQEHNTDCLLSNARENDRTEAGIGRLPPSVGNNDKSESAGNSDTSPPVPYYYVPTRQLNRVIEFEGKKFSRIQNEKFYWCNNCTAKGREDISADGDESVFTILRHHDATCPPVRQLTEAGMGRRSELLLFRQQYAHVPQTSFESTYSFVKGRGNCKYLVAEGHCHYLKKHNKQGARWICNNKISERCQGAGLEMDGVFTIIHEHTCKNNDRFKHHNIPLDVKNENTTDDGLICPYTSSEVYKHGITRYGQFTIVMDEYTFVKSEETGERWTCINRRCGGSGTLRNKVFTIIGDHSESCGFKGGQSYVDFMNQNYPPGFTYQDFGPQFTAEFFEPAKWVDLFERVGAKYVVLTSKHHEGYTLWPSTHSFSWNSMDVGPKRDLVGDLTSAIRENSNIRFGMGGQSYVDFMNQNYPPGFTYQDFGPQFTAEFFEPAKWVDLFERAGAKYVVLTSKHHEGYTLWPSTHSFSWNSMDVGPKRDLVGDLATAIRENSNIRFGLYHSLYEWYNPLYLADEASGFLTDDFVQMKVLPDLHELVNTYKPEIVWSDGSWDASGDYWKAKEFLAWLYNESPVNETVLTNDRWGSETMCTHGGYYTCWDRYNPGTLVGHKWENCMTLDRDSWGYRRNAQLADYLTPDELIKTLVETVACNGNLLLNVGPTKEGVIVPLQAERLLQLGDWLTINGDAIYGSTPWTHQNDTVTPGVWYTMNESRRQVYAMTLNWPAAAAAGSSGELHLGAVDPINVATVGLLGSQDLEILWRPATPEPGIKVTFPRSDENQSKWAWTLVIHENQ